MKYRKKPIAVDAVVVIVAAVFMVALELMVWLLVAFVVGVAVGV
jgi:hypothetical protein